MNKNEFKKLKAGDRIETRAACWGTVARIYQDDKTGHWLATVHFDGDPPSKTFTVWPAVVVQAQAKEGDRLNEIQPKTDR